MWLHILAAAAWIGGMLFLVLVLVPCSRTRQCRVVDDCARMAARWMGRINLLLALVIVAPAVMLVRGLP